MYYLNIDCVILQLLLDPNLQNPINSTPKPKSFSPNTVTTEALFSIISYSQQYYLHMYIRYILLHTFLINILRIVNAKSCSTFIANGQSIKFRYGDCT